MAIVLSSQGIVSGAFATFTVGMGHGATNYYNAAVLMKIDESGPFDLTTLMPSSGGSVTANAGTNLNTSLLALESGGTLASILAKLNASVAVTAAALPLPAGGATSALQTSTNTILGSPFQAGGSIGNASFGVTQATAANLNALVTQGAAAASAPWIFTPWIGGAVNAVGNPLFVSSGTGATWASTQSGAWNITNITGTISLPTGAATSALQTTTNTNLTTINTTLGTPMQQTGSTVGLVAGSAAIGSIIGRTTMATVTPTVTSNGAYAAGNEIGGLMTFAIGGAGSGELKSVRVTSKTGALTTAMQAYIFTTNPTNSTWTNNAAPAINTADIAGLLCCVNLSNPASGLGTHTIWDTGNIGAQFVAANLYVVLIAVSAATLASSSTADITVELGVRDD